MALWFLHDLSTSFNRKYAAFVTVADNSSISRSAEQLFIDASSVSRKISLIEEELSNQLFIRSNQGVALTDTGIIFYNFCQETLKICQNFWTSVSKL